MKDIAQFSSLAKPLFSLGLIAFQLSACAGRQLDVEEFSNGNRSLKSSTSMLSGATDETARVKAEQEADKICQRDGRAVNVKNITTVPNATTGLINVEIEFRCEPKVYQRKTNKINVKFDCGLHEVRCERDKTRLSAD